MYRELRKRGTSRAIASRTPSDRRWAARRWKPASLEPDDRAAAAVLCLRSPPAAQERWSMIAVDAVRRELRGSAIALVMVAATTILVYALIQYLDVRRGSVIYLLPVLLAGWHLGLIPALVAAVAGVLWSGYFFFSPYYSFYLARPNEILNLLLFMVVAVVTSHLANSMKRQTEIARKREKEMGDLYAFSRRLASASSAADIFRAIEEHLANLVQRNVVLFGAASASERSGKS